MEEEKSLELGDLKKTKEYTSDTSDTSNEGEEEWKFPRKLPANIAVDEDESGNILLMESTPSG